MVLRDGCFEGMGLAALLPVGVLVPLALTSSCSALINRRFLGLIEEDAASISGKARGDDVLVTCAGFSIGLLCGPAALVTCDHGNLKEIGLLSLHCEE